MKYQIYLQKDVSELINGIARALKKNPSTFIKTYLEDTFRQSAELATAKERKEVING